MAKIRVYLTKEAGGVKREEAKEKLLSIIKADEGIINEELTAKAGIERFLVDDVLCDLQKDGKIVTYLVQSQD